MGKNARYVEKVCGAYVDWTERFYECPECGEPIYEWDWTDKDLYYSLCPICDFKEEE